MRARKRDAWVATVRVSVPIDAQDVGSIQRAQQKVREIANLIPGSAVEIMHAGFGRMAVGAMTPAEVAQARRDAMQTDPPAKLEPHPLQPEIPSFLRRDPYNGATPMDPSGDGSFRGPDGAA